MVFLLSHLRLSIQLNCTALLGRCTTPPVANCKSSWTKAWLCSFTSSSISVQLDKSVGLQGPLSRLSLAIGGGRQFMLLRLAFIVEALTGPQRSRSIVYGCLYGLDVAYDFVLTTRCFVQSIGTIWLTFTTEPLFVIASRFKTVGSPDSEQAASKLAICSEFMHFIISSTHFSSSSFKRI
jgi:hypothetical protein